MTNIDELIDQYIDFFERKLIRLEGYEIDSSDRSMRKGAVASILDTLSRPASSPNELKNNRVRFNSVVASFGDWEEKDRISAPHVIYLLNKIQSKKFDTARAYFEERVTSNSSGRLVGLEDDPTIDEAKSVWPADSSEKVYKRLTLEHLTHLNLFYGNRNSLIHEVRESGQGMEISRDRDSPYYHGHTNDGIRTLELIFPEKFYMRIAKSVVVNIKPYLIARQINPYEAHRFGSSYLEDLN